MFRGTHLGFHENCSTEHADRLILLTTLYIFLDLSKAFHIRPHYSHPEFKLLWNLKLSFELCSYKLKDEDSFFGAGGRVGMGEAEVEVRLKKNINFTPEIFQ